MHREADRHFAAGYHVVLIGHAGHPEVIGTMGQLPDGAITLIETEQDAETVGLSDAGKCAYVTQTTLSVDDTSKIVEILKRRFPKIAAPGQRRYLLCHHQPPGGGQRDCGEGGSGFGIGGAEFFQFQPVKRGGGAFWRAQIRAAWPCA